MQEELEGRLQFSASGRLCLFVPNSLVLGAFRALPAAGLSLPLYGGKLNAHITVMTPEEIRGIGGPERISERGKAFRYRLMSLESSDVEGMDRGYSRAWFFRVVSPQLSQLRRTYGLASEPGSFHITVAKRKTGVLYSTPVNKLATWGSMDGYQGREFSS